MKRYWPFPKPLGPKHLRGILRRGIPQPKNYGPNPYIEIRRNKAKTSDE